MAAELEMSFNSAALLHLLKGTDEYLPPEQILSGLSGEQACTLIPGLPHSIATWLGHMLYWQERRLGWVKGIEQPEITDTDNFPAVTSEQWPQLVVRFLASCEELAALVTPELCAQELYRGRSAGFAMASEACHNAYHMGQIVLMRRLLGLWPPPEV